MTSLRRLAALALLGSAALAAPGCLSPTLPLPPPEVPDEVRNVESGWLVAGACDEHSLVTVLNERLGSGEVVTCRDGHYAVTIDGKKCDVGSVTEEIDTDLSPSTEFLLQNVAAGSPLDNSCQ
jgi:hypothetical protein